MPIPNRLRDLIRNIRSCKTAADERAIIQKECADIRNGFREEDSVFRCRNVAKVLYIYMLGYPAHFGQLEALKLIVSGRFTDKRIGYLGAMLLLDEHREVHLLMTNSLKNDMENTSQYIQSLALCTLGNVCSMEMARDLAPDVEKLMRNSNSFVKKKAVLCACRIVRKVPELMDNFLPLTKSLLTDKNHGVMLSGTALMTEMCRKSSDVQQGFKKYVPILVRILKNLIMAGYSPEHDVNGISDPFLQVRIIRLLRILGTNDSDSSETMNDILAQVATNTETSKNVGNAILYETVLTIMDIKSESGLRVLAVNILGRFLLNSDKNIRYVALNSLMKTVHTDMNAVQRHRTTVLDCLKDPDPSILRRAMELCLVLVNSNNIRGTMRELLSFLCRCPSEFKSDCSSGILQAAEKFSPNTKWHIDTILKVLTTSGNYVRDDAVPRLIHLISASDSMHSYAVQHLYRAVVDADDLTIQPLTRVAAWCLGEYGADISAPNEDSISITLEGVMKLLERILASSLTNTTTKSYAINAVMKLSTRYPDSKLEVQRIVAQNTSSHNIEVQQRSVEYSVLFDKHDRLRAGVLEPMPQFERPGKEDDDFGGDAATQQTATAETPPAAATEAPPAAAAAEKSNLDLLLDLVDSPADMLSAAMSSSHQQHMGGDYVNQQQVNGMLPAPVMNGGAADLLGDLLGDSSLMSQPAVQQMQQPKPVIMASSVVPSNAQSPVGNHTAGVEKMIAYDKDQLRITFTIPQRDLATQPNLLTIHLEATNSSPFDVTNFIFQAAVPKSFQLQLLPPNGNVIAANQMNSVKQTIKLNNANKVQPRMRLRLTFTKQGRNFTETGEVNGFPPSTWQ